MFDFRIAYMWFSWSDFLLTQVIERFARKLNFLFTQVIERFARKLS